MRSCLALFALVGALLLPSASFARCRPSPGDQLVVLTPRAERGILLLERRPAFSGTHVLTGPAPTTLRLRRRSCARACGAQAALQQIAPNLFAMSIGTLTPGTYEITTEAARGRFEHTPTRTARPAIAVAPSPPSIDRDMVGTGFFAPTVVLDAAAPPEAVGVLARWQGSSLFMPAQGDRTRFLLFAGRCRAPLPGFTPPRPGTDVELVFVDAEGRFSPSAHVTVRDVSLGAR